ncbi:MAG TPA: sodium:proton antiporter, partial [Comamonadaceae bacterium]|uniref:Na+/H+ antiporter NhaA n=1 Tax=Pulveribacter sp. TaxID=2678893 RepID=UPI000EE4117A
MNDPRPHSTAPVQLPRALIDRIAPPFVRFLHIEAAGGAVLLTFTIAALLLSNSPWADAFFGIWETRIKLRLGEFEFGRSLKSWINDGLMTLFFFLVALELKRKAVLVEMRN